jgi:excisionase family DNA binding protein
LRSFGDQIVPSARQLESPPAPLSGRLAVSVAEAAVALGMTRDTIYRLIKEERLTISKIGRRTLVHTASILRLLTDTITTELPTLPGAGQRQRTAAARPGRNAAPVLARLHAKPPPVKRAKAPH